MNGEERIVEKKGNRKKKKKKSGPVEWERWDGGRNEKKKSK